MERNIKKIEYNPLNPSNKNNKEKMDNISENEIERVLSFSKNKMIDIEETIEKCKEKDGIELLNFICSVMKERKRNILESLYKELGKDYLIANLEKTLNIENNGALFMKKKLMIIRQMMIIPQKLILIMRKRQLEVSFFH